MKYTNIHGRSPRRKQRRGNSSPPNASLDRCNLLIMSFPQTLTPHKKAKK